MDSGEERLKALGYKQQLKRGDYRCLKQTIAFVSYLFIAVLSSSGTSSEKEVIRLTHRCAADFTLVSNTAISFSIVSSLTCITGMPPALSCIKVPSRRKSARQYAMPRV